MFSTRSEVLIEINNFQGESALPLRPKILTMMRKIFFGAAALLLATTAVNAQNRGENFAQLPSVETTQSVAIHIPQGAELGYAYEHPLARRATIIGRVGLEIGGAWGQGLFGSYSYWMAAPSVDIEPRFYYGLDRRELHGRSTAGNAGSFLAVRMKNVLPFGYISDSDLVINGGTLMTPMWGMRRMWGDHWLFEFTAGATLAWGWKGGFESAPHLGLRFGYSF